MSSRHPTDKKRGNNTRFKVTRTLTDSDGKSRIETLEMSDEDALEFMHSLTLKNSSTTDNDQHGIHSLVQASGPSSTLVARNSSAIVQDDEDFFYEALQAHNEIREKHGVAPLRLNPELSKLAQEWADHLANTGVLAHSKIKYRERQVGENIRSQSWPISGRELTESWYKEWEKYDFENRRNYQPGTGHFTQIVWKGSEEVGFGQASGNSMNFAVAIYYPAGNYLGQFEKNVLPRRTNY